MKKSIKTAVFACIFAAAFQITAFAGFTWRVESAGQFLCGDDECDCDKYIGKERDGGCADRKERNRRDVYGGGSECDLYGKGI